MYMLHFIIQHSLGLMRVDLGQLLGNWALLSLSDAILGRSHQSACELEFYKTRWSGNILRVWSVILLRKMACPRTWTAPRILYYVHILIISLFVANAVTTFLPVNTEPTHPVQTPKRTDWHVHRRQGREKLSSPTGKEEAWEIGYVYPISGLYCKSQRILFYSMAIFVFCFRFHNWLSIAGIAVLTAFIATVAVHGFFLAWDSKIGMDLDSYTVCTLRSTNFQDQRTNRAFHNLGRHTYDPEYIYWFSLL